MLFGWGTGTAYEAVGWIDGIGNEDGRSVPGRTGHGWQKEENPKSTGKKHQGSRDMLSTVSR
eukprot:5233528-Amphidinium_carterae.3